MSSRVLTLIFSLAACAVNGGQPDATDFARIGLQVGEAAPDFSAPDQHGTTRTLSSLIGPKGAMLVFYRSADW